MHSLTLNLLMFRLILLIQANLKYVKCNHVMYYIFFKRN